MPRSRLEKWEAYQEYARKRQQVTNGTNGHGAVFMADKSETAKVNGKKDAIEQFVGQSIVAKSDYQLLDILWIFSYSLHLASKTAYKQHRDSFKKWLGTTCRRCLQKKYSPPPQFREKMSSLINLLNDIPDFLSYDAYYEDSKLLDKILLANTSAMLLKNVEQRVAGSISSELESKILSFVLNYIPEKIRESEQKAADFRAANKNSTDKYTWLPDFHIREDEDTGEISYFTVNTKEWTYLFDKMFDKEMFDKELKEFPVKSSYNRSGSFAFLPYQQQYAKCSFWQFGDELAKLGVGYWIAELTASGNVSLEFILPRFIYDAIQPYKQQLPEIEGIATKTSNIEAEKQKDEWGLGEVTEAVENVGDFSESEIEDYIVSNPDLLEDNLEIVGRQFRTGVVGTIDILCKDKNGDFVVVELKKDKGSQEAVGQIQNYLVWVDEHLAGTKQVRGIIVAKEDDKGLESAVKGSKFTIEVKVFGKEAPIPINMRYCDSCGKPNRKNAKSCGKCGNKFWLG